MYVPKVSSSSSKVVSFRLKRPKWQDFCAMAAELHTTPGRLAQNLTENYLRLTHYLATAEFTVGMDVPVHWSRKVHYGKPQPNGN